MRRFRRRRPAGVEQVPNEVLSPSLVVQSPGPIVLRLGPGSGLLDHPSGRECSSVANVWVGGGQLFEAMWPRDPAYGWFVAPVDLRLGHVLEFRQHADIVHGWVADVNPGRFVFVVTANSAQALDMAATAHERWSRSEIDWLR